MTRNINCLAPRERECLRLVPELRTSKAIGMRLALQPVTVDGYLKSAIRKLGASDRYHAARLLLAVEQPEATPLFGVPRPLGDDGDPPLAPPTERQDRPAVLPSDLREIGPTFDPRPPWPRLWQADLLGELHRPEGGHNHLTRARRAVLALRWLAAAVGLFLGLAIGLLVLASAVRELHHP